MDLGIESSLWTVRAFRSTTDGMIAFADFLILSANFGQEVTPHTNGDVNGDGQVLFGDFLEFSQAFGE